MASCGAGPRGCEGREGRGGRSAPLGGSGSPVSVEPPSREPPNSDGRRRRRARARGADAGSGRRPRTGVRARPRKASGPLPRAPVRGREVEPKREHPPHGPTGGPISPRAQEPLERPFDLVGTELLIHSKGAREGGRSATAQHLGREVHPHASSPKAPFDLLRPLLRAVGSIRLEPRASPVEEEVVGDDRPRVLTEEPADPTASDDQVAPHGVRQRRVDRDPDRGPGRRGATREPDPLALEVEVGEREPDPLTAPHALGEAKERDQPKVTVVPDRLEELRDLRRSKPTHTRRGTRSRQPDRPEDAVPVGPGHSGDEPHLPEDVPKAVPKPSGVRFGPPGGVPAPTRIPERCVRAASGPSVGGQCFEVAARLPPRLEPRSDPRGVLVVHARTGGGVGGGADAVRGT